MSFLEAILSDMAQSTSNPTIWAYGEPLGMKPDPADSMPIFSLTFRRLTMLSTMQKRRQKYLTNFLNGIMAKRVKDVKD
jgi:hypothetical protein